MEEVSESGISPYDLAMLKKILRTKIHQDNTEYIDFLNELRDEYDLSITALSFLGTY